MTMRYYVVEVDVDRHPSTLEKCQKQGAVGMTADEVTERRLWARVVSLKVIDANELHREPA